MATVVEPSTVTLPASQLPREWTLADLRAFLGDVPLERIRLYPPPGMATEQDALDIADHEDRLCELVDGILVEKTVGCYESMLALFPSQAINNFLDRQPLGVLLGADGPLWILPQRMRIPDLSFIRWERFPGRKLPRDAVFRVAPDLAVEILSPGNTAAEMRQKLAEYFTAGVRLVWYIDPHARTATVYTAPDRFQVLDGDGVLDGGDVLPGFQLRLRDLLDKVARESGA